MKYHRPIMRLILLAAGLFVNAFHANGAIGKNDIKAEAIVIPSVIPVPSKESVCGTPILVVVKLTNTGTESVLITKYNPGQVELVSTDGKVMQPNSGRDHTRLPELNDFIWIGPSCSTYIMTDCHLYWIKGRLTLGGDDNTGGKWWIDNIAIGKYQMILRYHPIPEKFGKNYKKDERGLPRTEPWYGEALASPVPIEIKRKGVGF